MTVLSKDGVSTSDASAADVSPPCSFADGVEVAAPFPVVICACTVLGEFTVRMFVASDLCADAAADDAPPCVLAPDRVAVESLTDFGLLPPVEAAPVTPFSILAVLALAAGSPRGLSRLAVRLGTSLISDDFSCALLLELAVGRIMRAKKPSPAPEDLLL